MTLISLGRVVVPTPGTPVALPVPARTSAARLSFQAAPANTGSTYIGLQGMNKSTLAGVSRVLSATGTYEVSTEDNTDGIALSQLAIDADVAGEALLVSYWVE